MFNRILRDRRFAGLAVHRIKHGPHVEFLQKGTEELRSSYTPPIPTAAPKKEQSSLAHLPLPTVSYLKRMLWSDQSYPPKTPVIAEATKGTKDSLLHRDSHSDFHPTHKGPGKSG